jgi:hypothetical protein
MKRESNFGSKKDTRRWKGAAGGFRFFISLLRLRGGFAMMVRR